MTAPSLRTLTQRTLRAAEVRGATLVVAVSGGGDSQALLHVLAALASREGLRLHAHGVNHGLRAAAAAELGLARALATDLGVFYTQTDLKLEPGANLQARARRARHLALEEVRRAQNAAFVATAHHQRDRAETVLIRLLRGAPLAGLAVLAPREGTRLRPFIDAPSELIQDYLARHRLAYATDPSNADPRFLRSRVRHELLPLLRALSPHIEPTLAALATSAATPPHDHAEDLAILRALPRSSLLALRKMASGALPRGRILLPHGLVARWDEPHTTIMVAGEPQPEGVAGSAGAKESSVPAPAREDRKSTPGGA